MRSSALCNSAKTVVAPISSTATLTSVPMAPVDGSRTLCTMAWMALAPCSPISPRNWAKISPLAASSPKIRPASRITMNSSGAIENIV